MVKIDVHLRKLSQNEIRGSSFFLNHPVASERYLLLTAAN